jgi:hypothetical protein
MLDLYYIYIGKQSLAAKGQKKENKGVEQSLLMLRCVFLYI